ncbi:MAG: ABC transporter ATP-binding protein [Alphaproteobacteria bacterium]|nr:ABC transporter ATP-binding protein [Alphaproteobacteria bacterium]
MTLELRQIAKTVDGSVHIHPTDLTFEPGSFNILLGTTLAGKTTLMQLMAGLDRPTGGSLHFNGKDVTGMRVQDRNVSMVYQQFINYPNFTVFENIASPLRVARRNEREIKERVGRMAELLKLTPMLDRRPSELSGGQQQRCAMARALVKSSDLVLLDEPLANLDFKLREELRDELPKLFADRDCVVVYATTEPTEALLLGGKTATMHEGSVTQFGPTGEVYRRPKDVISASVFSEPPINTATIRKTGGKVDLGGGAQWDTPAVLSNRPDGEYRIGLRPHHVLPERKSDSMVRVQGKVLVTELSGSESTVHFMVGDETWVSLAHGIHSFDVGATAELYADVVHAFYFGPDGGLIAD